MGKGVAANTQPFVDQILQREDNIIGFCSDDGAEQLLALPENFYRFRDFYHTQSNIWKCFSAADTLFNFEGGRLLNARVSFDLLCLDFPELIQFTPSFKAPDELSISTKTFAYFTQENTFKRLFDLCERKLAENDANNRWEDILIFAQLMTSLGLLFKSFFMELNNDDRINLFSSTLIRMKKYELKNKDQRTFCLYKMSLQQSIKFLRENYLDGRSDLLLKTTLLIQEGFKYQCKVKNKILGIGGGQRIYQILSHGCIILNPDSVFGRPQRIYCAPSELLIL